MDDQGAVGQSQTSTPPLASGGVTDSMTPDRVERDGELEIEGGDAMSASLPVIVPPSPAVPPGSANPTVPAIQNQHPANVASSVPTDQRVFVVPSQPSSSIQPTATMTQETEVEPSNKATMRQGSALELPASLSNNPAIQQSSDPVAPPHVDLTEEERPVSTSMDDSGDVELPELTESQILFLESPRYRDSEKTLTDEFALTEEDLVFLNEMDHAVIGGLIDLTQYITALRSEFPGLNAQEKDRLIAQILAIRFVPFGTDLRPSAEEAARKEKLTLPQTPYYHVYTKPLTFAGAAHEIALMSGIQLTGQSQERIRDIFMSFLKGVRSDKQVEEQLARTPDLGGVGAKNDSATAAVAAMKDISRRAILMMEDEYAQWLNNTLHPQAPAPQTASQQAETEEEKEIREIVARMPQAEQDNATTLATSIRAVLDRLTWKPEDPYLQRRLTNMVSTRLRDVRSRNEFFMKLMRDVKVGGLGIERKIAERVTTEVEQGYTEFRDKIAAEEKTKLDAQILEQERKIEERKRREAEERQQWYEKKVAAKKQTEEEGKRVLQRFKIASRGLTSPIEHPLEEKDRAREKAAFGELVPAPHVRVVGATSPVANPSRGSGQAGSPAGGPSGKTNDAVAPIPEKPQVVKVSAKTAEFQKSVDGQRPKLNDIAFSVENSATRLTGPLEQIGSMSLAQFRRLAKTPVASAKRIEDLVALLANESFERRVQGIQAWQKSPLQTMYLTLLAEAFRNGRPVNTLVVEKRAAGIESLTPEELDAIVKLNGVLRL